MAEEGTILALDIGAARIGLALASYVAKLPQPYRTIPNDRMTVSSLKAICDKEHVTQLVAGLPRGMQGQATAQTAAVEEYGTNLAQRLALPLAWQDEAVTSVNAEQELVSRRAAYNKADIDALAATYILEDYIHENL